MVTASQANRLEMLATAFGTSVVGLMLPPGRAAEERVLLALLEERGVTKNGYSKNLIY